MQEQQHMGRTQIVSDLLVEVNSCDDFYFHTNQVLRVRRNIVDSYSFLSIKLSSRMHFNPLSPMGVHGKLGTLTQVFNWDSTPKEVTSFYRKSILIIRSVIIIKREISRNVSFPV